MSRLEGVYVGTSPQGVEWFCYRREGEQPEAFRARLLTMRQRFREMLDKHAGRLASACPYLDRCGCRCSHGNVGESPDSCPVRRVWEGSR